jgi:hypothetical protein
MYCKGRTLRSDTMGTSQYSAEIQQDADFPRWHADIKPDNILLVNGRFKLADFGFSGFTPVAKTKSGTVPTDYIHGFTDSYGMFPNGLSKCCKLICSGAPEVTRMMRPNGTTSEVTQSIDTWSFGCVLSVAATWVVLGFQGVRQYETLRRLSPTNHNINDRFHDGVNVLPEVAKWHNYLRGHLRQSDTATSLVLDLIEYKMLRTETNDRIGMRALCKRLEKLIRDAKEDITNLETHTKDTDSLVLKALLNLETKAQTLSSLPKKTPLRRRSKGAYDSLMPSSSEQESAKDAAIRSIPLGQTTFRKEILENELQGKSFIQGHKGEFTDSPIDTHPPNLPQSGQETSTERRPITGNQHHHQSQDTHLITSTDLREHKLTWPPTDGMHSHGPVKIMPHGQRYASSNVSHAPPHHSAQASQNAERSAIPTTQTTALPRTPSMSPFVHQPVRRSDHETPNRPPEGFKELPPTNIPTITHTDEYSTGFSAQVPRLRIKSHADPPENLVQPLQIPLSHTNPVPLVRIPTPRPSYPQPSTPNSDVKSGPSVSPTGSIGPSIPVTPYHRHGASRVADTTSSSSSHDTEKQVVAPDQNRRIHYEELPHTIHDLPYPICWVRKEIDQVKPKGVRSHLKGIFHGEERQANTKLKKTYGKDREIVR